MKPEIDAAKILLDRLKNGKLSSPFTSRDVSQKGWTGLNTVEKTKSAIKLLVEHEYLAPYEPVER